MPSRNSRSVKAVAKILEPEPSEEAIDMAIEIVDAVLEIEQARDKWAVVARLDPNTPIMGVGTWTTELPAKTAAEKLCGSTPDRTGTGYVVIPLKKPEWLANLD